MKHAYIAALAAAGLFVPATAMAQAGPSASANGNAAAEIVQPISIACTNMNFSRLAALTSASAEVVLPAQGGPLGDASNIVVPGSRTAATPSNCNVTGELGLAYTVTPPSAISLSNGAATMALSSFTISEEVDPNELDRQLSNELSPGIGFDGFGVGATLTVNANQVPGVYTGTFTVSVQYN